MLLMVAFSLHKQKTCAHAQGKILRTAGGKKSTFYLLEYFNETYNIVKYSIYCFCYTHPKKPPLISNYLYTSLNYYTPSFGY
jgi:hypothetical protein